MHLKITSIISLFLLSSLLAGCIPDSCGMFGSGPSHADKLVFDRPFEPLTVAIGDTLILRPETYVHVKYTYTGSSNCDGEDFKDAPNRFSPTVLDDSLATATSFADRDSEPLWSRSENKIKIIGKQAGQTQLDLLAEWPVLSDEIFTRFQNIEIELTVTD